MYTISDSQGYVELKSEKPEVAVVFLHGLGASGYDFVPWIQEFFADCQIYWRLPHAGVRPVSWLNGELVPAWYDLFEASTRSVEDVNGLNIAASMVHAHLNELLAQGYRKIFLGGFSQGAALSLYSGLSYEFSLNGIAAFSGYLPRKKELNVQAKQHVWLSHGVEDRVLPLEFHEISEANLLNQFNVDLCSSIWPDMGHEISNSCTNKFKSWFTNRISDEC